MVTFVAGSKKVNANDNNRLVAANDSFGAQARAA
jgi:hypothetical protein